MQGPRTSVLPTTLLGRWAVGLAAAFFALWPDGGVVALVTIVRARERALTVFAALAPLAFAAAFVVAELIGG